MHSPWHIIINLVTQTKSVLGNYVLDLRFSYLGKAREKHEHPTHSIRWLAKSAKRGVREDDVLIDLRCFFSNRLCGEALTDPRMRFLKNVDDGLRMWRRVGVRVVAPIYQHLLKTVNANEWR